MPTNRVLARARKHTATILAIVLPVLITLALIPFRDLLNGITHAQVYLIAIAAAAALGGFTPAAFTVLWSALLADFYFLPPVHEISFPPSADQIMLLITGLLVAGIITSTRMRPAEPAVAPPETAASATMPSLAADDHVLAIVKAKALRPVCRLVGWTLISAYIDDHNKLRRSLDYPDTQESEVTAAHLTEAHQQITA